ncbi:hypothetical protein QEO94_03715 [Kingella negevensis]|uniref:hypothetical protein n=1 Tax=Kingella negevensis TaxID=1522312 RepID=UPI002543C84D|nr:hypothetical protein [Kingella negevensis]WII93915.1 hypothetical protein QEO94_03715 [Kingella negevensis]
MDMMLKILGNNGLLGAVFSTIFVIGLGYYARKANIVAENGAKVLSSVAAECNAAIFGVQRVYDQN